MPTPFPALEDWRLPYTSFSGQQRGRWLMYGDTRRATVFIDLQQWPPNPITHAAEYVTSFDLLPDGSVVVCSMRTDPASEYAIRIHPPVWPADPMAGPDRVIPSVGASTSDV